MGGSVARGRPGGGSALIPTGLRARLTLLGVGALAVRLIYILVIARVPVGVGGDAGFYHSAANQIAHGHFLNRVIFGHSYPTAEHPPLYPLALGAVSLLGGTSLLAHRVAGCVIGSLAVVLIAGLARRVGGPRAVWWAGGLAALYPPLITADGLVMSEPLFVLLVVATMLRSAGLREHPTTRNAGLLGVMIGLATLVRAEALLLVVLLAWPAVAMGSSPTRGAQAAILTGVFALTLAPWVARNVIVFHRVLLAADSNTLLAGANCQDTYYGHDIGWWSLDCAAASRTRQQLHEGNAATVTAWRYAGDHLARLPLIGLVRVLRTFNLFQPLRQGNREPRRRWVDIVGLVFFYPILALALLGLIRLRANRLELLAPVAMVVIVSVLGWGIGRFRVAADPSLLVLAATALAGSRGGQSAVAQS